MVVGMLATLLFLYPDKELLQEALESKSLEVKINYLIEQRARSNNPPVFMIGFLMLLIVLIGLVFTSLPQKIMNYLYPCNVFLFGKQKVIFEKRSSLISKVVWGILVALFISVLGGFLVWYVTT